MYACRFIIVFMSAILLGIILLQSSSDCIVRYQSLRRNAPIWPWISIVRLKPRLDMHSTVCMAEGGGHRIHEDNVTYRANQKVRRILALAGYWHNGPNGTLLCTMFTSKYIFKKNRWKCRFRTSFFSGCLNGSLLVCFWYEIFFCLDYY